VKLYFVTGSLVHGGAERHTIGLVNRLAERSHECHLAYVRDDASQLARLRGAASAQCLRASRYLDLRGVRALAGELARVRPDVVLAANQYALMYTRLALRGLAIPLAVTFHTTQLRNAKEWLQMLLYRSFFWSAERAIFVCEAQRAYWARRRLAARSNEVIHNGVDLEHWRPGAPGEGATIRRVLGFADADFVIGMSAVLRAEKNPLQLVQAVARLRRRGIPARALLIGDGEMRGAVEARARRLGIADEVRITGLQQDVRPLVGACDAMALCSTAVETFSLAALEAMALARPVVHSQVGGAAEMIRPGWDGYLFPCHDTDALVERLTALADRSACRRMGSRARETVEARFSERVMVERYEKTLMDLATTRSKHANERKAAGAH
jgi:glycosyltransferase involved in cell wall biosynthesis